MGMIKNRLRTTPGNYPNINNDVGLITDVSSVNVIASNNNGQYYDSSFPLTENPINESNKWINEGTVGLQWTNVRTTPGKAFGTQTGNGGGPQGQLDDSRAALTGTWETDYIISAVAFNNGADGSKECELMAHFNITPNNESGYECSFSAGGGGISFGQLQNPNEMAHANGAVPTGTICSLRVVGNVFEARMNGNLLFTHTDSSVPTGPPGIGFFRRNDGPLNGDFGWSRVTATEAIKTLVVTQPAGGLSGAAFTTQPAVRVASKSNKSVPHPGIVITAAITTGTGSLIGTTTAVTNSSGVATFTNLGINGTGTFVITFTAVYAGFTLTPVASSSLTITLDAWLVGKPAGLNTLFDELDLTQNVPAGSGNERFLASPKQAWSVVGDGPGTLVKITDANSLHSPPSAWEWRMAAGSYGGGSVGGVPISGGGTGSGSSVNFGSLGRGCNLSEFFLIQDLWLSSNYQPHNISEKAWHFEMLGATQFFLVQLKHNGAWFRASDEQAGVAFDPQDGSAPPFNTYFTLKIYLKRGNPGIIKVWVADVLRINYTNLAIAPTGNFSTMSFDTTRGGGGETLPADQSLRSGHISIYTTP